MAGQRTTVANRPTIQFVIVTPAVATLTTTSHAGASRRVSLSAARPSASRIVSRPAGYVSGTANQNIAPALLAANRLSNTPSTRRQRIALSRP